MAEHPQQATVQDHSIGNIIIVSLLALCGFTFIFLLGIF